MTENSRVAAILVLLATLYSLHIIILFFLQYYFEIARITFVFRHLSIRSFFPVSRRYICRATSFGARTGFRADFAAARIPSASALKYAALCPFFFRESRNPERRKTTTVAAQSRPYRNTRERKVKKDLEISFVRFRKILLRSIPFKIYLYSRRKSEFIILGLFHDLHSRNPSASVSIGRGV